MLLNLLVLFLFYLNTHYLAIVYKGCTSVHKNKKSDLPIRDIVLKHINNNIRQYVFVFLLFVIGIIIGILLIENSSHETQTEISTYINEFVNNLKGDNDVNKTELLLSSIKSNLKTTILMWFMGSTIIGIPIVLGIIIFKGICISYTVSALIGVFGAKSGIIMSFLAVFLQNVLFVPAMFALGVSGLNLYKVITKNRHKENVKIEIVRHTVFSIIIFVFIIIACFIEAYVSSALTEFYINVL